MATKVNIACTETIHREEIGVSSDRLPKDFFVGIYSHGRRLAEFQVELRNVVGGLAEICGLTARLGLNFCSGFLTSYPDEPRAIFSFFADFSGIDATEEEVAEALRRLDVVLSVKFRKAQVDGLIVDTLHFPTLAIGERSVNLMIATIGDMFQRLYDEFGLGAAFILYEMGVSAGENRMKSIRTGYGLDGIQAFQIILDERVAKGWGVFEVVEFDPGRSRATVRVQELFECLPFKSKGKEGRSHLFRGYLRGALQQVFNIEMEVSEEKCIAKGDPYCVFTCQPSRS